MGLKINELITYFDNLHNILVDLNISINNAKVLNSLEDKQKKALHGFFRHYYYQLNVIMIIQLSKVLSSNNKTQKINIHKLLNRLKNEKYDKYIQHKLSKNAKEIHNGLFKNEEDVKNAVKKIKKCLKNSKTQIEKIENLRNQVHAHYDPKKDPPLVSLDELEKLIKVSTEIYNILRRGLCNRNFDFQRTTDWSIEYILNAVNHSQNIRIKKENKSTNKTPDSLPKN
ncbi:MAG: hypothetical protein N4A45_08445 [Flavobacteriales bacterium]|jgi:hypothetical protein|nr:hypothetical protein [Flavobacteriales bacterium]